MSIRIWGDNGCSGEQDCNCKYCVRICEECEKTMDETIQRKRIIKELKEIIKMENQYKTPHLVTKMSIKKLINKIEMDFCTIKSSIWE